MQRLASRFALFVVLGGAFALLAPACATSGGPGDGGGGGNGGGDGGTVEGMPDLATGGCARKLAAVSAQMHMLAPNANVELRVRASDCKDAAVTGASVKFDLPANSGGSKISALSAQTDGKGEAAITLTAGTMAAMFDVTATTEGAAPVTFKISTGSFTTGSIEVTMTYAGKEAFTDYQGHLFQDLSCAKADPYSLPAPALASSQVLHAIADKPLFPDLKPAANYAVVLTAKLANGKLLGWGCADLITVEIGKVTMVTIAIDDIPIAFQGLYKLDNRFDMTKSLPPSVETAVNIFYEMTNDKGEPGVNGNPACNPMAPPPRYCGTDPAAFILDFVYRQICKWECKQGEKFDTCSQINHPLGDLSAIYVQNFMNWNGAIPRSFGMCGGLELAHGPLSSTLQKQIDQLVPGFVTKILNIAGDLATAIKMMHVSSELLLSERASRMGNYTHTLKEMHVDIHDWTDPMKVTTKSFDLAAAGLMSLQQKGIVTAQAGVLTIPDHQFELNFGKLLWFIYSQVLLPTISPPGQMWTKTEDILKYAINCNRCNPMKGGPGLGCTLKNNIGILDDATYEGFCLAGLTVAGAAIDGRLMALVPNKTVITLNGTAEADVVNNQQVAESLKNGKWNGKWEESGKTGMFPGTFTGKR